MVVTETEGKIKKVRTMFRFGRVCKPRLTKSQNIFLAILFLILLSITLLDQYDKKPKAETIIPENEEVVVKVHKRHILSVVVNYTDDKLRYEANAHYWDYVCGYNVEDLRSHPLFPFMPFRRDTVDNLYIKERDLQFGARVFGYLHPAADGFYQFAISSDDCSEFWLSTNEDPLNTELIAAVGGGNGEYQVIMFLEFY